MFLSAQTKVNLKLIKLLVLETTVLVPERTISPESEVQSAITTIMWHMKLFIQFPSSLFNFELINQSINQTLIFLLNLTFAQRPAETHQFVSQQHPDICDFCPPSDSPFTSNMEAVDASHSEIYQECNINILWILYMTHCTDVMKKTT